MPSIVEVTSSSHRPAGYLGLTPHGLVVCHAPDHPLAAAFAESDAAGLIALGGHPANPDADATCLFWKSVADHLIHRLCQIPDGAAALPELPSPGGRSTPRRCAVRNTFLP